MGFFKKLNELLFSKEENEPELNINLDKVIEKKELDSKKLDPNKEYEYCDFCSGPIISEDPVKRFGGSLFHKPCFKLVKKQVIRQWKGYK